MFIYYSFPNSSKAQINNLHDTINIHTGSPYAYKMSLSIPNRRETTIDAHQNP